MPPLLVLWPFSHLERPGFDVPFAFFCLTYLLALGGIVRLMVARLGR